MTCRPDALSLRKNKLTSNLSFPGRPIQKQMKKILFLIAASLLSLSASAQSDFFSTRKVSNEIHWGVRAGMNLSTMHFSGDYQEGGTKPGFHIGVVAEMPYMESLWFKAGLYYTMKGFKYTEDYQSTLGSYVLKEKVNPFYLQIPIQASYHYKIDDHFGLQVDLGPYFAVGTNGKWRYKYDATPKETDATADNAGWDINTEKKCFKKGLLHRFDMGLAMGIGVTYDKYYAGINYDWGWLNASCGHRDYMGYKVKARNGSFGITVGYNF